MRLALVRCRLLGVLVLSALASPAGGQILDVAPFIAFDSSFELHYSNYTIGAAPDSSMVVVTGRWTRDSSRQTAVAQRFAPDGTALGPEIRLDETEDVGGPRVVPDGRGGFVAYWQRNLGLPLVGRYLGPSGAPTSSAFTVAASSTIYAAVAGLPSGAVFVWSSHGEIFARLYDTVGAARGPAFLVAAVDAAVFAPLTVAGTGDGGFVVAWNAAAGIHGRRFDADGVALGGVELLADELTMRALVANPLGGFAIVGRRELDTHARRSGVWARRFDVTGTPRGPSFVVELADPEILVNPAAAFDPDGRLYVVWGYAGYATEPRGRAYDPTGRPLHASFRVLQEPAALLTLTARPDGRFVEARNDNLDLEMQVRTLCVPPHHTTCGDGVTTAPCERCDAGAANSDTTPDACRTTCAAPACGDGVVDHGEACDDGNLRGCDGCDTECAVEPGFVCGDGTRSEDCEEQCDDGPGNDDTVPNACRTDCRRAHCGDGVLDAGEACDDGNRTSCDGCSDLCVAEPGLVCGDGIPELLCGEQCDDGNAIDGDGCTEPCRLERIPGGGSPATDCLVEWVVDNPTNAPRYDKAGAISGAQACVDGDPACDFDGAVSGACTFHVRVCANNTDLAACDGDARLRSWTLRTPSATQAAKRPSLAAVRAAFTSVPGAIVGPALSDLCSADLEVPVSVRANAAGTRKPGTLILKSQATRYTDERDIDKLKLVCVP